MEEKERRGVLKWGLGLLVFGGLLFSTLLIFGIVGCIRGIFIHPLWIIVLIIPLLLSGQLIVEAEKILRPEVGKLSLKKIIVLFLKSNAR